MARRNWIQLFSHDPSFDLSNELERGYEAALLIQSLELEYYGDRPVRPDLELSVPRQVQLTILRRFRTALNICRSSKAAVEPKRGQLDVQELRQLQLIETVVARYMPGRASQRGKISKDPEPLPRSLLSLFDSMRRQLDPASEETWLPVFGVAAIHTHFLASGSVLILVPLMVQQISRTYLISPVVDHLSPDLGILSYPKDELEARSVEKLRIYKEEIEFEALLNGVETPTGDDMRAKLKVKAEELNREITFESLQAIKNVLSDLAALLAFVVLCISSRDELRVLRGFIDEAVYGLVIQPKLSASFCS